MRGACSRAHDVPNIKTWTSNHEISSPYSLSNLSSSSCSGCETLELSQTKPIGPIFPVQRPNTSRICLLNMSPSYLLRLASRRSIRPQTFWAVHTISQTRPLSQSALRFWPQRTTKTEIQSTTNPVNTLNPPDSDAAAQDQVAYDPKKTSPEAEMESADKGKEVSCV